MFENLRHKITSSIGARLASTVGDKVLGFLVFAYAGRRLGPALLGAYAFGVAINAFTILAADLGVLPVLIRRLARQWDSAAQESLSAALTMKVAFCLCTAVAGWGYAVWSTNARGLQLLAFGAVMLGTLQGVADTATGAYVARGRQVRVAWAEFLNRSIWSVISLVSLVFLSDYLAVAGMGLALLLGVVAQIRALGKVGWGRLPRQKLVVEFGTLAREGRPLLLQTFATAAYLRIDILVLTPLIGQEAVGQYAAAVRLAEPSVIVAGIVGSVLFPLFVRAGSQEGALAFLSAAAELVYWVVVGVALVLCLGSTWLLVAVFGAHFVAATGALRWLAFAVVALSSNVLIQQVLVAHGGEHLTLRLALTSAIVNVAAVFGLVPALRITGAGLASFLAYATYCLLGLTMVGTRPVILAALAGLKRPLLVAATAFTAAVLAPGPFWPLVVGTAAYVAGAIVVGRPVRRLVTSLESGWAAFSPESP